jgi:hypothetical protein
MTTVEKLSKRIFIHPFSMKLIRGVRYVCRTFVLTPEFKLLKQKAGKYNVVETDKTKNPPNS